MDKTEHDNKVHSTIIVDTDSHFVIDAISRSITNSQHRKTSLIQYDHNSERFSFDIDRYIEGHDILNSDKIRVHYINTSSTRSKYIGVYEVDDLSIHPDDDNKACFTWLISENATHYNGTLSFLVSFECIEGDDIVYRWNSAINNSIIIAPGINNSNAVVEIYADELLKWENYIVDHFDELELELYNTVLPDMVDQRYIERDFATSEEVAAVMLVDPEISATVTVAEIVQEIGQSEKAVMSQKAVTNALANYGGGSSVNVVQGTGNSTTSVMSQDAVTKELDEIWAEINYVTPTIEVLTRTPSNSSYELPATFLLTKITHRETNVLNIAGTLTLKRGNTVLLTGISPVEMSTDIEITDTVTLTTSGITYTLSGLDKKGKTISKSMSVSAYYTSYIGASENDVVSNALISSLTNTNSASLSGTRDVTFTGSAKYIWFISTKSISSIKSGGFDVPYTLINSSYSYNGTTYKCYRTDEQVTTTENSFVIT